MIENVNIYQVHQGADVNMTILDVVSPQSMYDTKS